MAWQPAHAWWFSIGCWLLVSGCWLLIVSCLLCCCCCWFVVERDRTSFSKPESSSPPSVITGYPNVGFRRDMSLLRTFLTSQSAISDLPCSIVHHSSPLIQSIFHIPSFKNHTSCIISRPSFSIFKQQPSNIHYLLLIINHLSSIHHLSLFTSHLQFLNQQFSHVRLHSSIMNRHLGDEHVNHFEVVRNVGYCGVAG